MKNKITQEERLVYMLIGKRGGEATAKRYGKKYMSNLGKKGARKRWGRAGSKKKKLL
jgi:general stress protein YciG